MKYVRSEYNALSVIGSEFGKKYYEQFGRIAGELEYKLDIK